MKLMVAYTTDRDDDLFTGVKSWERSSVTGDLFIEHDGNMSTQINGKFVLLTMEKPDLEEVIE